MLRALVSLAAVPLALAGSLWFAVLPEWHVLQVLALAAAGGGVGLLTGGFGAVCATVGMIAVQGSDMSSDNGFFVFVLPLISVVCLGGLLASVIVRAPSLGKKVPLGPFGPGGA